MLIQMANAGRDAPKLGIIPGSDSRVQGDLGVGRRNL